MMPISFIMRAEPKHLTAEELRAGVEHCEQMIARFEAHIATLRKEQSDRGIKTAPLKGRPRR